MKRKSFFLVLGLSLMFGLGVSAQESTAPADQATADAYNQAVDLKDHLDNLDVTVEEVVSVAGQPLNAEKTINIQTTQMSSEDNMKASIDVQTGDGDETQYYEDGYLYSDQNGTQMKFSMTQDIMKGLLDRYVYLDLTAEYLSSLKATENKDGTMTYAFEASPETIKGYEDKLLQGIQEQHQISIVSIEGTVDTDAQGNIAKRELEMVYTVNSGEQSQLCVLNSTESFHSTTRNVKVEQPKDLNSYDEKKQNQPAINITKEEKTLYVTDDLNVRAQNSVTSAIIGGVAAGQTVHQTGYTSDGWIQISYNDAVAYVSAEYISETKPVIIKDMSGDMYATASVNVRASYSTDSAIIGTLSLNEAVTTTGYTDNGWIRVSYGGKTAYVNQSYLTWNVPVEEDEADAYTGYLEGSVIGTDTGKLQLQTVDGTTYRFDTSNAEESTEDGIVIGDWVGVTYRYRSGKYKASEIEDLPYDTAQRNKMVLSGYRDMVAYGTVIAYDLNQIIVALDNGTTLSGDLDYVTINGDLYTGAYVIVNYIGSYMYTVTEFED
ncbi:MAG: SH3 domain-containing protein [Eubacteriales bacterium]|nr:SH3 domain-containing protein [Eubacteriales bacterium]